MIYQTRVILHGDAIGAFWWPIGAPWIKYGCTFDATAYERRCVNRDGSPARLSLREMLGAWAQEHEGDSSAGIQFSPDSVVEIRFTRAMPGGDRVRRKFVSLSRFPSVADCLASWEDYETAQCAADCDA